MRKKVTEQFLRKWCPKLKNGINRPISTKKWPPNRQNQKSEKKKRPGVLGDVACCPTFGMIRARTSEIQIRTDDGRQTTTNLHLYMIYWYIVHHVYMEQIIPYRNRTDPVGLQLINVRQWQRLHTCNNSIAGLWLSLSWPEKCLVSHSAVLGLFV